MLAHIFFLKMFWLKGYFNIVKATLFNKIPKMYVILIWKDYEFTKKHIYFKIVILPIVNLNGNLFLIFK